MGELRALWGAAGASKRSETPKNRVKFVENRFEATKSEIYDIANLVDFTADTTCDRVSPKHLSRTTLSHKNKSADLFLFIPVKIKTTHTMS